MRLAHEGDSGTTAEPIASIEDMEFPKNSINIDKFTGFFDKFLKIFKGKCGQMQGCARAKIPLPQKHRENTTALQAARSGKCGELPG